MIAPLVPYAMRGAIWYQGESNADRGKQYQTLLPAMIRDWRTRWALGDFPFLIVQLANYMAVKEQPGESRWAELREAQLFTAQRVPNVGLAVIIDIGEAADIHPRNKQEVGRRLALNALATTYGAALPYSGPLYRELRVEAGALRLLFDHVEAGLVCQGERLTAFAIAGEDRRFVWADARIDGDTIVVASPQVPAPVAVRYGWTENPACTLYNTAGLPASPFRTDDWPV
jgi:sialate O-acetylesterase